MSCREMQALLATSDDLRTEQAALLERHLAGCPACAAQARREAALTGLLRQAAPPSPGSLPAAAHQRLDALFARPPRARPWRALALAAMVCLLAVGGLAGWGPARRWLSGQQGVTAANPTSATPASGSPTAANATDTPAATPPAAATPTASLPPATATITPTPVLPGPALPISLPGRGEPAAGDGPGFILFNRRGALWRADLATGAETELLPEARHFRMAPDGSLLAYVVGDALYLAGRDGADSKLIAQRVIGAPAWAPDSSALALTIEPSDLPETVTWTCHDTGTVAIVELGAATIRPVAAGCDPAWAPDSQRLAYVTGWDGEYFPRENIQDSVRIINRDGSGDWAALSGPLKSDEFWDHRVLFRAPAWDASGDYLTVFADAGSGPVDISNVSLERVDARRGGGQLIDVWQSVLYWSVRRAPDGRLAFAMEHYAPNPSVAALAPDGPPRATEVRSDFPPITARTEVLFEGAKVTAPAWSPDGGQLAVIRCLEVDGGCDYQKQAGADVRLLGESGLAEQPLIREVDLKGELEWHR